jgi:uncharacterized membrane protein YqhA
MISTDSRRDLAYELGRVVAQAVLDDAEGDGDWEVDRIACVSATTTADLMLLAVAIYINKRGVYDEFVNELRLMIADQVAS